MKLLLLSCREINQLRKAPCISRGAEGSQKDFNFLGIKGAGVIDPPNGLWVMFWLWKERKIRRKRR